MEAVDNNQFEIKSLKTKRKIIAPSSTAYLNPGLDILLNEDPMCNTALEIAPNKKRKRTRSCSDIAAFENSALDLGTNKVVNEFLVRELNNVKKNVRHNITKETDKTLESNEPIYANLSDIHSLTDNNSINFTLDASTAVKTVEIPKIIISNAKSVTTAVPYNDTIDTSIPNEDLDSGISILEQKSISNINDNINALSPITNVQTNVTNQVFINNINNTSNLNLSFLDRLGLDSPNLSNQSLFYDDDLNESNIMEIKTITIITKKKRLCNKNTNPFLDPNIAGVSQSENGQNPFLNTNVTKPELEYTEEVLKRPAVASIPIVNVLEPRRLFVDTNSTISTVNESLHDQVAHEYENIDHYRSESPIYEHIDEANDVNKQSRILGHDVSRFSAVDIMNLNKMSQQDSYNDSNDSKNSKSKHSFMKVGKKVFKTLKKTFKSDKSENNVSLNPYEVPRKAPKQKTAPKESGIENPALYLDNSDEIEIEEIDDEHQYETVKTLRNTHLNTNITPLKEKSDNADISHNKSNTPGKKVRFDSTLNQEKVITGNSFDYDIQSPGFDVKLDKYHDELENCINERKFLQQNM